MCCRTILSPLEAPIGELQIPSNSAQPPYLVWCNEETMCLNPYNLCVSQSSEANWWSSIYNLQGAVSLLQKKKKDCHNHMPQDRAIGSSHDFHIWSVLRMNFLNDCKLVSAARWMLPGGIWSMLCRELLCSSHRLVLNEQMYSFQNKYSLEWKLSTISSGGPLDVISWISGWLAFLKSRMTTASK